MKIYSRIEMTLEGEILREESHEWAGQVAELKGGGGGGASGKIDFPDYIKTAHNDWVDNTGTDTMTSSMVDLMNSAVGNSPFTSEIAYDPDTELAGMLGEIADFDSALALLSSGTGLDTLMTNVLSTTRIDNDVTAFETLLDNRVTSTTLPRFQAGMRNINAVVSSAFVIGQALIEEGVDAEVAKYQSGLRMKAFSDDSIRVIGLKLDYQKALSQMYAEAYRVKIVAKKEEKDKNIEIDEADGKWDLEVYQYGANLLAAPGGGTAVNSVKGKSAVSSAIGGGLTGAAAGALTGMAVTAAGGPISMGMGAVIGGALGIGGSLL